MINGDYLSTEYVSAFEIFESEDSPIGIPYATGVNDFSCELKADDPAGLQVEILAAVAYRDGRMLWCYHEVANGPFLSYPGEVTGLNLTLRVKIDG